ncbi:MAG: hypothetical protein WDW36_010339 [Sanguina aurantia]
MGKLQDSVSQSPRSEGIMTADGAAQKASLMLAVTVACAGITWAQVFSGNYAAAMSALSVSKIAGFVALAAALGTMFKPHLSPYTGLVFCSAKGLALGGMSAMAEMMYPGIALNAMMLTFGTAATLLLGFQARVLSVSDNFRNGVGMVTGGLLLHGDREPAAVHGGGQAAQPRLSGSLGDRHQSARLSPRRLQPAAGL